MSIHRNRFGFDGEITFECDECGEENHTDNSDFQSALAQIREDGWVSSKEGGEWHHHCSDCTSSTVDVEVE